ncbi:MutS-related protein [Filimonas effusa]|uniref:DNA mismatch repair protein n=1 Tax=Filimonas effusa TaxID=2508721 RepID=A0A4Q1DBH7_9BACT|nr:DNA mismatch repair protein [Filimonas effusa]RXK86792.1 DNA mismatch repair protein [Filimonas effusa]
MKEFITDKQTLEDLNLTGKYNPRSLFSLFNKVQTSGAERLLDEMFRHPLTDADAINRRSAMFRYYQEKGLRFSLESAGFRDAEAYLGSAGEGPFPVLFMGLLQKKVLAAATRDERYGRLVTGINAATSLLQRVFRLLPTLDDYPDPQEWALVKKLAADQRLSWIGCWDNKERVSFPELAKRHHLLRQVFQKEMEQLLELVYKVDLCIAVAAVASEQGFCYAKALDRNENVIKAEGLRHPALKKGVANSLYFNRNHNLLFLTGANMAGKSTLMKSLGIALYMGHMGFPVAVTNMQFSVRDGLFTSINVADNLNQGYSHFYAEVLRVKKVAEQVSKGLNLVVVFDELFKGTNVKDAFDATLSVTKAFGLYRNCVFVVSTHIIEVGEVLRAGSPDTLFRYLPTVMEGAVPRYPYTLAEGITNDRQGMMIIQNEGVFDLLE